MTGLPSWINTIVRYYPTYQIAAQGEEYEDIDWNGYTPIPESVLDAYRFVYAKELKIKDFSTNCEFTITYSGFTSSALGAEYKYASDITSQVNLIGNVISMSTALAVTQPEYQILYPATLVSTSELSYELHTFTQLRTVLEDLTTFKLGWYEIFNDLRIQVNECTTVEDIDELTWPGLDPDDY